MSFNPYHNDLDPICRTNYEEHFLLYADNELSPAEKLAVEHFIKAHPDLEAELELLLLTRLPMETVGLEEKENLLAHNMQLNFTDEGLILYIDNELNQEERKALEQKLKEDKPIQVQYADLLKTKPGSADKIIYPYKKELYRYEAGKPFLVYGMRIAAAVAIILSMSIFVFNYESKPGAVIAGNTKTTQSANALKKVDPVKTEGAIEAATTKPVKPALAPKVERDNGAGVVKNVHRKRSPQGVKKQSLVVTETETDSPVIANYGQKRPEEDDFVVNKKTALLPQQIINRPVVTAPPVGSLNHEPTATVTVVERDVVKIGNEKKSSIKSFLRKATSFIERTTNITTTNENNELLIGAVALKL